MIRKNMICKINTCRVCGNSFFERALLKYKNMPGVAQYLPGAKELINDKGVDLEVCQCSGCGLVQLKSEPVSYYREVLRAAGISQEMNIFVLQDHRIVEVDKHG